MIGNNSCGTHSLLAGKTVDNIHTLRIVLYDGTQLTVGRTSDEELEAIIRAGGRRGDIYGRLKAIRDRYAGLIRERYPDIPRRVSGYNLDQLLPENGFNVAGALVGSEGTCASSSKRKPDSFQARSTDRSSRLDTRTCTKRPITSPILLELKPIGLEGFEGVMIEALKRKGAPNLDLIPEGGGYLLVEFGADNAADADAAAQQLVDRVKRSRYAPNARIYTKAEAKAVWRIRESGPRAAISAPGAPPRYEGWDDSAVPPHHLGAYLRDLRALQNEYNYQAVYYGHFGHACIHMQTSFDLQSEDGIRNYGEFVERAADLVVRYGGSVSGEHGDGQSRGALLPKMFGPELMHGLREFKAIWDPDEQDEPGQADRRVSSDRKSAPRRRLQAAGPSHPLPVSRRQRVVREGCAAVHRRGRMPQARLRNDVSQLHGDPRRGAQHARARAHAVRGAAGRGGRATRGTTSMSSAPSISVCRARRASRSARPTSTLQPIVPSSCRTITKRGVSPLACIRVRHDRSVGAVGLDAFPRVANALSARARHRQRCSARKVLHLADEREMREPRLQHFQTMGTA